MAITVTATQGGSTANGMLLRLEVLTNCAATQNGQTASNSNGGVAISGDVAITPTFSNSRIYMDVQAKGTGVLNSLTGASTQIDNVVDGTNGMQEGTAKGTSLTTAGTLQTIGWSDTNGGSVAGMEVVAASAAGPAEDASAPAVATTTGATAVMTASFTPPAGSLLVALVSASSRNAGVMTMTVSDSSSLTWTEVVKGNATGAGYAGVWIAQVGSGSPAGTVQSLATVPVARRRPGRAVVQFTPVVTVNTGHGPAGRAQPLAASLVAPRRKPSRAVVQFTPVTTTNGPAKPHPQHGTPSSDEARGFKRWLLWGP